jgi:hypothetical protein
MNAEKARRMAQAFARGLAFMRGHALMAMDANKNGETWITIGAEPGPDGKNTAVSRCALTPMERSSTVSARPPMA